MFMKLPFLFGLFDLPWWGYLAFVLVMTHITIATVTIYYHRCQAHNALDLHPFMSYFFRFWGWLTTGMVIKEWVAIHRLHHAKDDGPLDPHSPQVYGLWRILFFGVERYYVAAQDSEMLIKRGHGTPRDWLERKLFMKLPWLGVVVMLIIDVLCFGLIGFGIWLVQMLWIPFWAAGVINGVGHWPLFRYLVGYRNNDAPDASANIIPWGILIGGEELHNNHHAYPSSAKLSLRWYEFDIGWMYIRLLEICNLATVKRCLPHEERSRELADGRTLALIRGDLGFIRGAYRRLLLREVKRELQDAKLAPVRDTLLYLKQLLVHAKWNADTLRDAEAVLPSLSGSGSLLPRIGEFIAVFTEIKMPLSEIGATTIDREKTLINRLNRWVGDMRTLHASHAQQFAKRLVQMVAFQSKRA